MGHVTKQLTRYFSEIQRRANLNDVYFGDKNPHQMIARTQIEKGKLSFDDTAALFRLAKGASQTRWKKGKSTDAGASSATGSDSESKPISVVISLVTLRQQSDVTGLLLLPAMLSEDGTLNSDFSSGEPWIPASRLSKEGTADRGDVD